VTNLLLSVRRKARLTLKGSLLFLLSLRGLRKGTFLQRLNQIIGWFRTRLLVCIYFSERFLFLHRHLCGDIFLLPGKTSRHIRHQWPRLTREILSSLFPCLYALVVKLLLVDGSLCFPVDDKLFFRLRNLQSID